MSEKVLRLKIDSSGAKQGGDAVKKQLSDIHNKATVVIKQFENLNNIIKRQEAAFNKLASINVPFEKIASAASRTEKEMVKVGTSTKAATDHLDKQASANDAVTKALSRLNSEMVRLKAAQDNQVKALQGKVNVEKMSVGAINDMTKAEMENYEAVRRSQLEKKAALKAIDDKIKAELKGVSVTTDQTKSLEDLEKVEKQAVETKKKLTTEEKLREQLLLRQEKALALVAAAENGTLEATLRAEAAAKKSKEAILNKDESLKKLHGSSLATKADLEDLQKGFQNTAKAVVLALGPLSGVAARVTAFSSLVRSNTGSIALFVGGLTALAVAMSNIITLGNAFERQMLIFNATLKSTQREGEATAQSLNAIAEGFESATLASLESARSAVGILMTFEGLAVDMFEGILFAAQGLSEVFGGALEQNARLLARALEEPARNLDSLRRIGVQFSDEQREMIRVFEAAGMRAEAQAIIWERIGVFQTVAKDAAQGLAGAMDSLGSNVQKTYESISQRIETSEHLAKAINSAAFAVSGLGDNTELLAPLLKLVDGLVKSFANTVEFLANNLDVVTGITLAFAAAIGVKAVAGLAVFASSTLATATGIQSLSLATNTLVTRLVALSFWFTALVAAGYSIYKIFFDNTKQVENYNKALEVSNRTADNSQKIQDVLANKYKLTGEELAKQLEILKAGFELDRRQVGRGLLDQLEAVDKVVERTNRQFHHLETGFGSASEGMIALAGVGVTTKQVFDNIREAVTTNTKIAIDDIQALEIALNRYGDNLPKDQLEAIRAILNFANSHNILTDDIEETTDALVVFQATAQMTGQSVTGSFKTITDAFDGVIENTDVATNMLTQMQQGSVAQANAAEIAVRQFSAVQAAILKSIEVNGYATAEQKRALDLIALERNKMIYQLENIVELQREMATESARNNAEELLRIMQLRTATESHREELERTFATQDKAQGLIDSWINVSNGIEGAQDNITAFAQSLLNSVDPAVNADIHQLATQLLILGQGFNDSAESAEELHKVLIQLLNSVGEAPTATRTASKATTDWAKELDNLKKSLDPIYAAEQERTKQLEIIAKGTKDVALQTRLRAAIEDKAYKDIKKSLDPLYAAQQDYADLVNSIIANVSNHAKQQELLTRAYDNFQKTLVTSEKLLKERLGNMDEEIKKLGMTSRELAIYTTEQEFRNAALEAGIKLEQRDIDLLREKASQLYDTAEAVRLYEESQEDLKKLSESIADTFIDGFEAAMKGGEDLKKWFGNLLRSLALQALRNQIIIPIVGEMMGVNGSLQGSILGGGGMGSLGSIAQAGSGIMNFIRGGGQSSTLGNLANDFVLSGMGQSLGLSNVVQGTGGYVMPTAAGNFLQEGVANSPWGMAGSMVAGMLGGRGTGNMIVDTIASTAGSVIGGAIGGPIGAALGGALGSSLGSIFGGRVSTRDTGIQLGATGENIGGNTYQDMRRSGGWFRSSRRWTETSGLPSDVQSSLQESYSMAFGAVEAALEVLDIQEKSLNSFRVGMTRISTKGKSSEEIEKAVNDWMTNTLNSLVSHAAGDISRYAKAGENGVETLARLADSLMTVNQMFEGLGLTLYKASLQGGAMASHLVDAFGGMENMVQSSTSYFQNFYTEAEKMDKVVEDLENAFFMIGEVMPSTREGFRDLVEGLDLTTRRGRETYAALLTLNPMFAEYITMVEELTAAMTNALQSQVVEAYQRFSQQSFDLQIALMKAMGDAEGALAMERAKALEGIDESLRPYQEYVWALEDEARKKIDLISATEAYNNSLARAAETLSGFFTRIDDWVNQRRATSGTPTQNLQTSEQQFMNQLAKARGGDRDAIQNLTRYADQYLKSASDYFASGEQYQDILQNVLKEMSGVEDAVSPEKYLAMEIEKALMNLSEELRASFNTLPPSLQKAIAGLPPELQKAVLGLTPELDRIMATVPDKIGNDLIGIEDNTGQNVVESVRQLDSLKELTKGMFDNVSEMGLLNRSMLSLINTIDLLNEFNDNTRKAAEEQARREAEQQALLNKLNPLRDQANTLKDVSSRSSTQMDQHFQAARDFQASSGLGNIIGRLNEDSRYATDIRGWLRNQSSGYYTSEQIRAAKAKVDATYSDSRIAHVGKLMLNYEASLRHRNVTEQRLQGLRNEYQRLSGSAAPFAKGGVFTNTIVDTPTNFNMGLMGEAGPEAIMPLTRHADGSLGVRADIRVPAVNDGNGSLVSAVEDLKDEVRQLREENKYLMEENNKQAAANVRVNQYGFSKQIENTSETNKYLSETTKVTRLEAAR